MDDDIDTKFSCYSLENYRLKVMLAISMKSMGFLDLQLTLEEP